MLTLVAGTGYTGRRLLHRLPPDNVVGLSRSAIESDRHVFISDFDAIDSLPVALTGGYSVVYTVPPGGESDDRLQRFISLLSPMPERFVYLSTTGVYGDCRGAVVDEATPANPGSRMSKPRVAAENLLTAWAADTHCSLVVLRVPGIYGPGRLGLERIESGTPVLKDDEANPGNRIHVDDLVSCCVAALAANVPAGIYNVGDGDHRSSTWFANEVARQARLAAPPQISRGRAAEEFSPTRLAFLASSRIVDTRKMREVLGVTPRYADPVEGITASI
jgi:nucleoside-diphosphate-sugar epimerase